MSFGLRREFGNFQPTMDMIWYSLKWQFVLVYLANTVQFSKMSQQYIDHVRNFLILLHSADAKFKLKECEFLTNTIYYLGQNIGPRHLKLASLTTNGNRALHLPTDLTELRSFIGLCNVFRRFVLTFAWIAAVLKQCLKKDQPAPTTPRSRNALHAIKALINASLSLPVPALPYFGGHIMLDTDVCSVVIKFVILQKQPAGITVPIENWYHSITHTKKWCNTSRCNFPRSYRTTSSSGHTWTAIGSPSYGPRCMKMNPQLSELYCRLACLRLRLIEFDFEAIHGAGIKHHAAHALSRLATNGENTTSLKDIIPLLTIDEKHPRTCQRTIIRLSHRSCSNHQH